MEEVSQEITKETFYSGHNGTSEFENYVLMGAYPSSLLLFSLLHLVFPISSYRKTFWTPFVWDFLLLVSPVILACTILSDYALVLLLVQLATSLVLILAVTLQDGNSKLFRYMRTFKHQVVEIDSHRHFLTHFRVCINIATVICILAVDFQVFPRRFAKAETYGRGFMDLGVGLFMIGNAVVAPEARGKASSMHHKRTLVLAVTDIFRTVISCSPLLILGVGRLLSLKTVDYHEHVSEYGVHWNFFFTLAAVRILVTIVFTVIPVSLSGALAIILTVCYQYLLNMYGLKDYILHGSDGKGSRSGILDANREGIYSCVGYSAIYLAGVSIGSFVFQKRSTIGDWMTCLLKLAFCNATLFLLSLTVCPKMDSVSRRLANLPYVVWVVTSFLSCLIVLLSLEMFVIFISSNRTLAKAGPGMVPRLPYGPSRSPLRRTRRERGLQDKNMDRNQSNHNTASGPPHPLIVAAISRNQLLNFLLANVLTGLVNIYVDTLSVTTMVGCAIVTAYTFVLCLIMVILHHNNISTKFW
ncbi:phosphatidylinositol-glycan biosynthesis class W protein-like [Apostichopus japonicus]|uniref:phosphatidylinositol-glycan biosynthesis class W protein-like n=1 Tax=Stichopus japonicus TaxID=307972 RepID=UPI003AB8841F